MIDASTIEKLEEVVQKSVRPHVEDFPNEGQRMIVGKDGEIQFKEMAPEKEIFYADSLHSFVDYALDNATEESAIFIEKDNNGCGFVKSRSRTIRSAHFIPLTSTEYQAALALTQSLTPKDLIRLIRRDLYPCLEDPAFLNSLRKIDFSRKSNGSVSVEHGRESLGRSVEDAVQAKDGSALAEEIKLRLRKFRNEELPYMNHMTFVLDIDYDNQRIRFEPTARSSEEYANSANLFIQNQMLELLKNKKSEIPVYVGRNMD